MKLTSKQIYNSIIHGAYSVIKNREMLNHINVFPVRDGDTGSNLSSMMKNIIKESIFDKSVKKTLESVADSALYGARGNSGIIFAQYFNGLCESIEDYEAITIEEYAAASNEAVDFAYKAIENPVEGTMITLMREWGSALSEESEKNKSIIEIFTNAFSKIEGALEKTKDQLEVLKKADVVDSGAKGFTYFIEGALYYIKTEEEINIEKTISDEEDLFELKVHDINSHHEKYRYCTECLLEGEKIDSIKVKSFLSSKGNSTVVASNKTKCRIHIHTNEPAEVFDYLHEIGTIVYQKIDDMVKQKEIVNYRKYNIALITDSIGDLPKNITDKYQINVVYLNILFDERTYMDKLTIRPQRLLDLADETMLLPTSSQPNPKQIENLFDYLATYYESAIVMTVSKALSGTYNSFKKMAESYDNKGFKISVINTKQNSAAEGLLVKKCAELIDKGVSHDQVVKKIEEQIQGSKILVQVQALDNMIKSGRLSVSAGNIGKRIGMKPIVTLDNEGKGALDSIAFSSRGSNKKILSHLKKLLRKHTINQYAIVHVDNITGANELRKLVENLIGFEPEYIEETSSIVAAGAGRGAIALAYIIEN